MRYLKAEWPDASLTACDMDTEAIKFCSETFGAKSVWDRPQPHGLVDELDQFDLIWVGSLFSHLDGPRWRRFLRSVSSCPAEPNRWRYRPGG